jgi:hypothetical protein
LRATEEKTENTAPRPSQTHPSRICRACDDSTQ